MRSSALAHLWHYWLLWLQVRSWTRSTVLLTLHWSKRRVRWQTGEAGCPTPPFLSSYEKKNWVYFCQVRTYNHKFTNPTHCRRPTEAGRSETTRKNMLSSWAGYLGLERGTKLATREVGKGGKGAGKGIALDLQAAGVAAGRRNTFA